MSQPTLDELLDWADKHVNAINSPSTTGLEFWYIAWDRVKWTRGDSIRAVLLKAYNEEHPKAQ